MAEVITRSLAATTALPDGTSLDTYLEVTSAGTGPWHEGEPMHANTAVALARGGFPDHPHIAHQFPTARQGHYDLLVALDRRHQQTLRGLGADPARIVLLRAFDADSGAAADVPDPFYGDVNVFDDCRDMIATACAGLVAALAAHWDTLSAT
jgi:protein-tyrosine phosphatase